MVGERNKGLDRVGGVIELSNVVHGGCGPKETPVQMGNPE